MCNLLVKFIASDLMLPCFYPLVYSWLVGIPTSLKNMSSSVGMMKFPTEWKVIKFMFQTTNQIRSMAQISGNIPRKYCYTVWYGTFYVAPFLGSWNLPSGYLTSHSELENPKHKWRFSSLGKSSISMGHLYHGKLLVSGYLTVRHGKSPFLIGKPSISMGHFLC